MRFLWASLAMLPFAIVLVAMATGHMTARSCCAAPAEDDARLRAPAQEPNLRP